LLRFCFILLFVLTQVVEMGAYALLMYLPYFVAEAIEMSGIVATLFAGMPCRHYAHANLSPDSQVCIMSQSPRCVNLQ
jgi:NhaP-type Na+/H+ or K+/H+ antiporter